MTVARSTSA